MQVTTVVSGLSYPWDLTWVGDLLLYDLRAGQVWSKRGTAAPRRVTISGFPSIFAQGEGGLLGMVADPAATTNSRFYTCQAVRNAAGGALDVRVLRWRLTSDTTATSDGAPVVTGIPLSSGRHSGCRLRFGADGYLYVGTGDAAIGTNPQNLQSLGGKVLRVRLGRGGAGRQPLRRAAAATRASSGTTATATCRAWRCVRARASCGRWSTAPTATTRSTSWSRGRTTAGTRCPATTSRDR